jgi:hypothetical protein
MRYIITTTQLHRIIYKYLDDLFGGLEPKKEVNPYDPRSYKIELISDDGVETIDYWWYAPGEYDDGQTHNGIGNLQIHPMVVDNLRGSISIRETKVMDIVADWFSEKFNVDIDETVIYPSRDKAVSY